MKTSFNKQAPLTAALLLSLAGCTVGPDYVRPAASLPATYTAQPVTAGQGQVLAPGADIPAQWWQLFHSPQLDQLVRDSLQRNPTLDEAQAALRGAMESMAAQQASAFPVVSASFTPTRQKVAGVLSSPTASNAYYYNLHTAQVTVSYTPDVFGGNRRQVESLAAQVDLQREQLEATHLTLTSNVVNAAIQEAALRGQLSASRAIVDRQTRVLAIYRQQYALGQVADADVAAQESALANSVAGLPPLEKQLAQQRNLLHALTGRFPNDDLAQEFTLDSLQLPASLPLTLPSTLVEHRPDVRAAEAQLHAASANIGVAKANRLPNITLGVNAYGSAASSLGDLFKSGTGFWSLAGSVTQPIFDAGALKHQQGAAQAAYDAAAASYRATVLNAFQNVADALQAIQSDASAADAAARAEQAASRSLAIARKQQELGDISVMTVLASEQAYQQAKVATAQAQANRLADSVALFQALGGGWWNR